MSEKNDTPPIRTTEGLRIKLIPPPKQTVSPPTTSAEGPDPVQVADSNDEPRSRSSGHSFQVDDHSDEDLEDIPTKRPRGRPPKKRPSNTLKTAKLVGKKRKNPSPASKPRKRRSSGKGHTPDTSHTSDEEKEAFIAYLDLIPPPIEAPDRGLRPKITQPPPVSCDPFEFPPSITYDDLIDKIAVASTFQRAVLDTSSITWQPSKPAGSKPRPLRNDTGLKALKKGLKSGDIYVTFRAALPNAGQVPQLASVVQASRFPVPSGLIQQGSIIHDTFVSTELEATRDEIQVMCAPGKCELDQRAIQQAHLARPGAAPTPPDLPPALVPAPIPDVSAAANLEALQRQQAVFAAQALVAPTFTIPHPDYGHPEMWSSMYKPSMPMRHLSPPPQAYQSADNTNPHSSSPPHYDGSIEQWAAEYNIPDLAPKLNIMGYTPDIKAQEVPKRFAVDFSKAGFTQMQWSRVEKASASYKRQTKAARTLQASTSSAQR